MGLVGLIVASISNAVGLDGWGLAKWAFDAGKLVAVGIVAWQIFRGDYDRLMRRLTLAFAAVVFLAPMIQSWYVVWLIPLFAVTGIRDDWQVKAVYFMVSFFMVYAISDQLEVFPYLQTEDLGLALALARNAAAIIALLFALYLIFLDPKTKQLFSKPSEDPVTTRPGHLSVAATCPRVGRKPHVDDQESRRDSPDARSRQGGGQHAGTRAGGCRRRRVPEGTGRAGRGDNAEAGATPAFLDYRPRSASVPFPGVICASVNDAVVPASPTTTGSRTATC